MSGSGALAARPLLVGDIETGMAELGWKPTFV